VSADLFQWIWERLGHNSGDVFIETGSKAGDTLAVMRPLFRELHSVEINAAAAAQCAERFRDFPAVHVHHGDSREVLPRIIDPARRTVFYLDAHCEGAPSTVPEADTECPLLREVEIILAADWAERPLVFIDDVNMLRAEYWRDPESNHAMFKAEDWPRFEQVRDLFAAAGYVYGEDRQGRIGLWA